MGRVIAIAVTVATAVVAVAVAQGSSSARPLPGLPSYTAGYKGWTKLNAKLIPRRTSDPHDGRKNVYASRLPARGSSRFPVGTVIVKEAFRPGQTYPYLAAVMRKTRARAHNGWVMIEWTRRSRTARFSEVARGQICTSCHVQARKTDYVFTRVRR